MHRSHLSMFRPRQVLPRRSRRGAVIPLFVFLLIILIAAAAFTIDVAYMHAVRSELQHSVDAAARAASNSLGSTQDLDVAREAAKDVAAANSVAGSPLELADDDIVFGQTHKLPSGAYQFVEGAGAIGLVNAVRVRGARTNDTSSGPVRLFMGSLMGRENFEPQIFASAARVDRDIMIVVDRSASMAYTEEGDVYPNSIKNKPDPWKFPPHPTESRWAGLIEATKAFREAIDDTREEERIGLVSYAGRTDFNGQPAIPVLTDSKLTSNVSVIVTKLEQKAQNALLGWTDISIGLDRAVVEIRDPATSRPFAFKMIVLMTDGVWNTGRDPSFAAQDAADLGIVVHTVTFSAAANQADMREVAQITGGRFYHAPTREELKQAFKEIAYSIPVILVE